jgi:hypothetical protein
MTGPKQGLGEVTAAELSDSDALIRQSEVTIVVDDLRTLGNPALQSFVGRLFADESDSRITTDVPDYSGTAGTVFPVLESYPVAAARLEATLSPEYSERVLSRYRERYIAVEGYIAAGKLPQAYRLPELSVFTDRIKALAPAYDAINENGRAEFEFVPQGLTTDQWSALFAGYPLPGRPGFTVDGASRSTDGYDVIDPTKTIADASLWDVITMDTSEEPKLRGMSADASRAERYDIEAIHASLRAAHNAFGLPTLDPAETGLSGDELVLKQLSPSIDMQFAVQLGRIERGERTMDNDGTWTIGKENVVVDGELQSVFSTGFHAAVRQEARSFYDERNRPSTAHFVRLSARGRDLVS